MKITELNEMNLGGGKMIKMITKILENNTGNFDKVIHVYGLIECRVTKICLYIQVITILYETNIRLQQGNVQMTSYI